MPKVPNPKYKFEQINEGPWSCPPWRDGCVFDREGNVICVLQDNETRAAVAAVPDMVKLLEKIYAVGGTTPVMIEDIGKLLVNMRVNLWQQEQGEAHV